jgi:hypothetical protein
VNPRSTQRAARCEPRYPTITPGSSARPRDDVVAAEAPRDRQHRDGDRGRDDEVARQRAAETRSFGVLVDERDRRPADRRGRPHEAREHAGDEQRRPTGSEADAGGRHRHAREHHQADRQRQGTRREPREHRRAEHGPRDATHEGPAHAPQIDPRPIAPRREQRQDQRRQEERSGDQHGVDQRHEGGSDERQAEAHRPLQQRPHGDDRTRRRNVYDRDRLLPRPTSARPPSNIRSSFVARPRSKNAAPASPAAARLTPTTRGPHPRPPPDPRRSLGSAR